MKTEDKKAVRVLAISSGGGHWTQLIRLHKAFATGDVVYASVSEHYADEIHESPYHVIPDSTRWSKIALIRTLFSVIALIGKLRPDVVVSTGAAPGAIAIVVGKLFGARTVWIDSMANVETLSSSGQLVSRFADLWITQWEHLAIDGGPSYFGSVVGDKWK